VFLAMPQRILIWYRQDLRTIDHLPLHTAVSQGAEILPLYCFDDRLFGQTPQGFPKTGAWRAQFLLESVADLRRSYRSGGGELMMRRGQPEAIIPQLVQELAITAVYFHTYPTAEELAVEQAVIAQLSIPHQSWWGHTLYQPEDLPFSIAELPELFTKFRKIVEAAGSPAVLNTGRATPAHPTARPNNPHQKSEFVGVRPVLPAPSPLVTITGVEPGQLPSLSDWGLDLPAADPRSVLAFQGGETAGLARLDQYFWQQNLLSTYKETRNGMVGADYSSKFSPWLALGCLSPRYIYDQVKKYEIDRVQNESTYWLIFELLWRDYFALIAAKHGHQIFRVAGLRGVKIPWQQDKTRFALWCQGQTGFPLVDANMRELLATGFMSNRGRQNVASFLTKNLGIDWRWGAEWFESLLIDYDVASNWGNWNYTAGVGNDARGFRFFNIYKQAKDYDPQGAYVKLWLPELAQIPAAKVHNPAQLLPIEQQRWGIQLGVDYPRPVVDLFKSATANQKVYEAAFR
jgi:deoxyribodipyrimidine photo-lyase